MVPNQPGGIQDTVIQYIVVRNDVEIVTATRLSLLSRRGTSQRIIMFN